LEKKLRLDVQACNYVSSSSYLQHFTSKQMKNRTCMGKPGGWVLRLAGICSDVLNNTDVIAVFLKDVLNHKLVTKKVGL
jgi:hypothetical protein